MRLAELRLLRLPKFRRMLLSRIDMRVRQSLPVALRRTLAAGAAAAGAACECPICGSRVARFRDFGHMRSAWCPVCLAMDRHRLVWLFLTRKTDLFDARPKRVLHVAPEPALETRLRAYSNLDYVTADLLDSRAMVQMDIMDIQFPGASFDAVYCSHVLEHVPDDRQAMRELRRILRPDGWAVFMVPITAEQTVEDPGCRSAAERERRFGQHDHVRRYGPDFAARLSAAGFDVQVYRAGDLAAADQQQRMGLPDLQAVYFCRPAPTEYTPRGEHSAIASG